MSNVKEATAENFDEEVIDFNEEGKIVLVDFWAPWCAPCRQMSPIIDEISEEMKESVKVVTVNVASDYNKDLVEKYEISNIPVIKIFSFGEVVSEILGLRNKEYLVDDIKVVLSEEFK